MASEVVQYLQLNRQFKMKGMTSSNELASYLENYPQNGSLGIVLVGSEPLENLTSFLKDAGFEGGMSYFPSRTPLTLYQLHR